MEDIEHNGYLLVETTRGGSAGQGYNKTASIKIMNTDKSKMFGRYFRFHTWFGPSKKLAIEQAKNYIDFELNKKSNVQNSKKREC